MPTDRIRRPSLAFAGLAAGVLLLGTAPSARAEVFSPETFTLDNGMQVIVVTNRAAPVVHHILYYRIGGADDPAGATGLAHLLEHMMFRGTATYGDGEFSAIVSRHGGNDNAYTDRDVTAYHQTVARDRLELVMGLEADRMINLVLDDGLTLIERDVVAEERNQRVDTDPGSILSEQMIATLFLNHPYGRPIIGWEEEIRRLEPAVLDEFYQRWYAPNNTVLVVTGDVDAAELRPLAEEIYGPIPARPLPERMRPPEPPHVAPRQVSFSHPDVRQPLWHRLYLAPALAAEMAEDRDPGVAYALQVLSDVMGGSTGRLYRSLVIEQGIAIGAGFYYTDRWRDHAMVGVFAVPADGVEFSELEAAVAAELARLIDEGITQEEVDRSAERMIISAAFARDSLTYPAQVLGRAAAAGIPVEEVEAWPDRISAVTAEQVTEAARQVLRLEASVTGTLRPAQAAPAAAAGSAPASGPPAHTETGEESQP